MRTLDASNVDELTALARNLVRSKRVAFVVGAGISTASGIPDFRSATTGLFATLRERNPDVKLASGKDLFHSNLFQREDTTRAFYMMIAELKRLADSAQPTDFHRLMKELDDANKLFRIYTQNIDALEAKTGLTYGLGEWKEVRRGGTASNLSPKGKGKQPSGSLSKPGSPSSKLSGKKRKADEIDSSSDKENLCLSHPLRDPIVQALDQSEPQPFPSTSQIPWTGPSCTPPVASQASLAEVVFESPMQLDLATSQVPDSTGEMSPDKPPIAPAGEGEGADVEMEQPSGETSEAEMVPESSQDASGTGSLPTSQDYDMLELSQTADISEPSKALDMPSATPIEGDSCMALNSEHPATASTDAEAVPAPVPGRIVKTLTTPSVIPLHGTLESMHCTKCHHTEPLNTHLPILDRGNSIYCPKCQASNASRNALGERTRGTGVMKVSVVLYGEEHAQAARVGEIAEKDLLRAARPDYLIVAGTTLKIPGVKKLVKELAKVIKPEIEVEVKDAEGNGTGEWVKQPDQTTRIIYVNNDAPTPETVWSSVFDVFVQGDLQTFANAVREELRRPKQPTATVLNKAKVLLDQTLPSMLGQTEKPGKSRKKAVQSAEVSKGCGVPSGCAMPKQGLLAFTTVKSGTSAAQVAEGKHVQPESTVPESPKKPREKCRPGWKGWTIVPVDQAVPTKSDYLADNLPKRVKGSPTETSSQEPASPSMPEASNSQPAIAAPATQDSRPRRSIVQEARAAVVAKAPEQVTLDLQQTPDVAERYCKCNSPYTGSHMIYCAGQECPFNNWMHTKCIRMSQATARSLPDSWKCSVCKAVDSPRAKANKGPGLPKAKKVNAGSKPKVQRPAKEKKPAKSKVKLLLKTASTVLAAELVSPQSLVPSCTISSAPSPPSLASDISTAGDAEEEEEVLSQKDTDVCPTPHLNESRSSPEPDSMHGEYGSIHPITRREDVERKSSDAVITDSQPEESFNSIPPLILSA